MSFSNLGLNEALLSAVARKGYTQATPIQLQAIPAVLKRSDLLAAAQTGTGKTAAFVLPMLQCLSAQATGKQVRALILTPTRELAAQVAESARAYGGNLSLRSTMIFGGVSPVPQIKALRAGVDIVVATPGRLLDHVNQGNIDLSRVEFFVLDEADRMLDMGFIHDIRRIVGKLPARRQNLMFSATFSDEIRTLASSFLNKPVEIDVAPRNTAAELVDQQYVLVHKSRKRDLLSWMISRKDWRQVLVFTRTKHGANRLCQQLNDDGLTAEALHGNKSQSARTKALANFSSGRSRVLVATDIAARGIDIVDLPHVVNYELPNVPEDYVHRIGRTGRAGAEGQAISLVEGEELDSLRRIERLLKREIPVLSLTDQYDTGLTMADALKASANRSPANSRQARPQGNRPPHHQGQGRPGGNAHAAPRGGSRGNASKGAASAQRRNANHRPSQKRGSNSTRAS